MFARFPSASPPRRVFVAWLVLAAGVVSGALPACAPARPDDQGAGGERSEAGGPACAAQSTDLGAAGRPDEAVVRRVIDGDTIELSDGRLVRYVGIDAPEVRRKVGDRWVVDPEPFGLAATEANRRLVERRRVRLEYDAQRHDRYGRVLAYVYVEDRMVNEALVEAGYAQPMTIPPNVRYADRFRVLARQARRAGRGLWGREFKKSRE